MWGNPHHREEHVMDKENIRSEMIEAQTQCGVQKCNTGTVRGHIGLVKVGTSQIRGIDCAHVRNFVLLK